MANEITFGEVSRKNLYETVADKLEESIMSNSALVGTKLPPEQTVAENYGVSRNVVREAFKTLHERGIIEVKNGEGAYVSKPSTEMLAAMLNRMVKLESVPAGEFFELRWTLEVSACQLVARRIDESTIDRLYELKEEIKANKNNPEKQAELDIEFHRTIVSASGNKTYSAIFAPLAASLFEAQVKSWDTHESREESILMHERIYAALKAHDGDLTQQLVEEHLRRSVVEVYAAMKRK